MCTSKSNNRQSNTVAAGTIDNIYGDFLAMLTYGILLKAEHKQTKLVGTQIYIQHIDIRTK